jgi:GWxTD domain-containing protein
MGMLASGLPLPFVGRVAFLAGTAPDSTHVIVALSMSNSALSFTREADDRFRANYTVAITLTRGTETIARSQAREEVIVSAFRETTRSDETLIFQEILDAPPGDHDITVVIRDEGSQRSVQQQSSIRVPRFERGSVSVPLPIVEVYPRASRDSLPSLIVNPRATVVFGRDTIIPVYIEQYDSSGAPLRLDVRNETGRVLWSDTLTIPRRGDISTRVVAVPLSRIGIGVAELSVAPEGQQAIATSGVFVGFGEDLPVATFENMLRYLRYFATPVRLERMRNAAEEQRPAEWAAFVRETDAQPETPEHEDLRAYFGRLVRANTRFRDESSLGWQSDRGRVYLVLGEPDQIIEPRENFERNRQQVWEYRALNAQLVFYDQSGTGRWRLTPNSNVRFETEARRRLK